MPIVLRTTYGVLANYETGFGYKYIRTAEARSARSDSTGRVYESTQTLSTQAWPLSVTERSVVHEVSA